MYCIICFSLLLSLCLSIFTLGVIMAELSFCLLCRFVVVLLCRCLGSYLIYYKVWFILLWYYGGTDVMSKNGFLFKLKIKELQT